MSRVTNSVPRAVFFLAGVAVAALTFPRRKRAGINAATTPTTEELKKSLADLDTRIQSREAADAARFAQVETKLEEHSAKLADLPSTNQIVSAMEQLLSRTMATLDDRLATQAHSIDVLRTTVSQTDSLLERVLESLDSLQSQTEPADFAEDPMLSRPTV